MSYIRRKIYDQNFDSFLRKWSAYTCRPLEDDVKIGLENGGVHVHLKAYIDRILDNKLIISDISKNSFSHSNGFKKLTLWTGPQGEKVRLHFWPRSDMRNCDIHNHFWDFSSLVIYGQLRLENYMEVNSSGYNVGKYVLNPLSPNQHIFDYKGNIKIIMESQKVVLEGRCHSLLHNTPHRICSDISDSVTFLLQGPRIKEVKNHIYSNREIVTSKAISQKTMTTSDVYEVLLDISSGIERNCDMP